MKELAGSTGNVSAVPLDGKFIGMAEIAIIVSEPVYRNDGNGGFARIRETEILRFMASMGGLKSLIKALQEALREVELVEKTLADVEFKTDAEAGGDAEGHA